MPDYDNLSMVEIFKLDSADRIKNLNKLFLDLEKSGGDDPAIIETAMREAHSLKAAARVVGADDIQIISHKMEELIEFYKVEKKVVTNECIDLLLYISDSMIDLADAFVEERDTTVDVKGIIKSLENALEGKFDAVKLGDLTYEVTEDQSIEQLQENKEETNEVASKIERRKSEKKDDSTVRKTVVEKVMIDGKESDSTIRVGIEKLEKMMNLSGEIYTNTLRLETDNVLLNQIASYINGLHTSVDSMINSISEDDNKLVLFRDNAIKTRNTIENLTSTFVTYKDSINNINNSLGYLGTQLQDEIMRSRMLPISTVFDTYSRLVRDLARESKKKINLIIEGSQITADKRVLEILKDPLTHLIRNACDHAIESVEDRVAAGKSETGKIKLIAFNKADRVIIQVEDDGKGIDAEALKEKLIEKDLVSSDKIDKISREEIMDFIFLPGFSTAKSVTAVSGRGVGLDVVKANLSKIDGYVNIETQKGLFTRFTLSLPLTLAVTNSLLFNCGGEKFCIPMTRIEEVLIISDDKIKSVEGKEVIDIRGEIVPLVCLADLWDLPILESSKNENKYSNEDGIDSNKKRLIIVGKDKERVALWADEFHGEKAIVSKHLDRRLHVQDISGGTILDDGEVAYIVDVESLVRSVSDFTGTSLFTRNEEEAKIQRSKILIVEDSLTVRELEKKMLEANGYDVVVAVDGLDGWNKVREQEFDLMITDIEMPNMDGFDLIRNVKHTEKLSNIPTIIVSYRERDEDKRRGIEVGADLYITKSQFDDKILLEAIGRLIGGGRRERT